MQPPVVGQGSILADLNDSLLAVIVRNLKDNPSTQSPVSAHAPPYTRRQSGLEGKSMPVVLRFNPSLIDRTFDSNATSI